MKKVIVYLDDPTHALRQLMSMKRSDAPDATGSDVTHWVLVACAPRMTRRISKWVTHSARESWRARWSEKLFAQVAPHIKVRGDRTTLVQACGPLADLTGKLIAELGAARVVDARRPKFGQNLEPVTAEQPMPQKDHRSVASALLGLGAMLILAAE